MTDHSHTNRLIDATSPYLLQHAHNPVDWYPWGEEALARARSEDKPILVSIGYSACHWCHVMEHESFEDAATAALMNRSFVCIKVDREERPDIDTIYMTAVQAMTGSGGWPLNVFLLPDGTPFYGGTYFPPDDKAARYRMASWKQVLASIADAYATRRDDLRQAGSELIGHIRRIGEAERTPGTLNSTLLDNAVQRLAQSFDSAEGGFGGAPKFPQPMTLEFLLRAFSRSGDKHALEMANVTLTKMAQGGMYDQVGGGFHRYSVDAVWLVPHFEKMLYDNAQLARVYVEAFQVTGNPLYRRIAEETLDYVLREMTHPDGGFFSAQDADSEGEEGKFFVWTPDELRDALGGDAMLFSQLYDVTRAGNFEGKNILHLPRSIEDVARVTGTPIERLEAVARRGREKLYAVREQRVKPGRDDKVLTAWNGLMLRAFVAAAQAFDRSDYLAAARANADFLLRELRRTDGRVLRTWKDGRANTILGFLEDYALFADGLLALYSATGESRWLRESIALADNALALFWDDSLGGLYDTASDAETLVTRPRDVSDNATPSGNSVMVDVLLRLAALTGNTAYRDRADHIIGGLAGTIAQFPTGFGRLLSATDFALADVQEVAIVGDPDSADTKRLLSVLNERYRPHTVVALLHPDDSEGPQLTPLLADRPMIDGNATAYVCRHFACQLPVTEAAQLAQQIQKR